jgi:hypothetical protein
MFGGRVSCMRVVSGSGFRANPGDRDRFDKTLDRLFRSKIRAGQGGGLALRTGGHGRDTNKITHTTPYKLVLSPRVVREGNCVCPSFFRCF